MTPFAVSLDLKKEISLLDFDEKLTEECQLLVGGKISQIEIRMFRDKNPSMERPDENLIKFWQNWCEIHSQDTNEPMVSVGKIEREGKKIILYAHQKTYAEYLYSHQKPKPNKLPWNFGKPLFHRKKLGLEQEYSFLVNFAKQKQSHENHCIWRFNK